MPRKRLLNPLLSATDDLIVVAAPGGFGKSVLAEQIAAQDAFDYAFMVPIGRHRSDSTRIYTSLVDAMLEDDRGDAEEDRSVLGIGPSEPDVREKLREGLESFSGQRVCVVIDDVALDSVCDCLTQILGALTAQTHQDSAVVVTTRELPEHLIPALGDAWIIDKDDLRFRDEETREVLDRLLSEPSSAECAEELTLLSDGHAALLVVLARHCLDGDTSRLTDGSVPLDVRSRLVNLALRHLEPDDCLALHVAALMGEGTLRDLEWVLGTKVALGTLHDVVPLLTVQRDGEVRFEVHALARAALGNRGFCDAFAPGRFAEIRNRVLQRQAAVGRMVALFTTLIEWNEENLTTEWLRRHGRQHMDAGEVGLVQACLSSVDIATVVSDPALLLLDAVASRHRGAHEAVLDRAKLALELGLNAADREVAFEALMLLARGELDIGRHRSAREHLLQALPDAERSGGANAVYVYSYLTLTCGQLGHVDDARKYHELAKVAASDPRSGEVARAHVRHAGTMITALLEGDWSSAVEQHRAMRQCRAVPMVARLLSGSNETFALAMTGRLSQFDELYEAVNRDCEEYRVDYVIPVVRSCRAMAMAAWHDYCDADELASSIEAELSDDTASTIFHLVYRSQWRRAAGNLEGAVQAAEQGMSLYRANPDAVMLGKLMEIEHAAVLVAVGDVDEGARIAYALFTEMSNIGAKYHALCADLVLVECALRKANFLEAITRLAPHADYIATESANLSCAFYIRAYPALLGALAEAMGVERIPAHLLKLLNEEEAVAALKAAWNDMDQDKWHALANRMLSASEASALAVNLSDAAECQVRLFGGMEVSTPRGVIPDRAWRKRKARTLFAMLVTRQGLDVSREQLFEQLWPDMEPERARNNFYVVWNSLKAALTPELPRGAACPYVESVGGLCRISRDHVHSDLDDFDEALAVAKDARETDDTQRALWAYRKVADLYQGELLSGDLYDEWFAPVRDRCRQQFGDAMLAAAKILFSQGEIEQAAWFLRRGIAQDSLREDLYQELLRCQIASGQRSAAVETYMSCLENMVEQLGLDPSLETRKLYDKVLAMEE